MGQLVQVYLSPWLQCPLGHRWLWAEPQQQLGERARRRQRVRGLEHDVLV
jgi:hypothetical protein